MKYLVIILISLAFSGCAGFNYSGSLEFSDGKNTVKLTGGYAK